MLRLDINLVFTIVNIVVLYICMRLFLFKPVNKILKQRQDAVQKQFDDAKEAQDKAEALKQEYEASLTNAKAESDRIMEEAKKKAVSGHRHDVHRFVQHYRTSGHEAAHKGPECDGSAGYSQYSSDSVCQYTCQRHQGMA